LLPDGKKKPSEIENDELMYSLEKKTVRSVPIIARSAAKFSIKLIAQKAIFGIITKHR